MSTCVSSQRSSTLTAILCAALLGSSATGIAQAADPVVIPAILPVTGGAAFLGKSYTDTLKIIEDRTNKAGGVGGHPVVFNIEDDQSSPQVTVQLTNAAVATNAPLIINGGPLALCAAAAPLQKSGPVMYCLSPSMRPDAGSFAFAVMPSAKDVLIAAMQYYKSRGFKRIGVLNGTDATGADADNILGEIIKMPEYAGMSYVAYEHFNLSDLSVTAQLLRIKSSGAQAMIAYTTGTPIATVLHGISDVGLDMPVFTSNGNMSVTQLDGYKSFVPKELLFAGFAAFDANPVAEPAVKEKIAAFRADMKAASLSPDLLHAIPYDPALLIIDAMKHLGGAARAAQMRAALAEVRDWPGVLGRFDFKAYPQRGLGLKSIIVLRWDPAHSDWVAAAKMGA